MSCSGEETRLQLRVPFDSFQRSDVSSHLSRFNISQDAVGLLCGDDGLGIYDEAEES